MELLLIFDVPTVASIIVIGIIVLFFEFCIDFLFKDPKKKSIFKSIGRVLFISGLTWLFNLTLENVRTLESIEKDLIGVNEKATAFDFFKPYETIENLNEDNTFRKLLKSEMDQTHDRLKQIEKGELQLSREEVVPIWEALISKYSTSTIKATNVVSISDWAKFSPNQGLEAHEEFLAKKDTRFERLFIYDSNDTLSINGTLKLANEQIQMADSMSLKDRFQIKMIDKDRIDNTTYGTTMYSNFGTLDIVIFDNQCLLQTITQYRNRAYEIVNGVVTNNQIKIDLANEMFDKLWGKAENLNDFKKNIVKLHARNNK